METLAKILPRAVSQIGTSGRSTIHPNIAAFDWQFETAGHPELSEALAAAQRFCSHIEYEKERVRAINHAATELWNESVANSIELGLSIPDRPARQFVSGRWLSLMGKSGRGKTHLAKRINAWRQSLNSGLYFFRWTELLQRFRQDRERIGEFIERCQERKLMIIDDVGSGHETEFAAAILAEIADNRVGKPTVITSNLSIEQLAGIDARIASRMFRDESEVFTFRNAPDYCISKKS